MDGSKSSIISIHALLAESDALGLPGWLRVLISIHALLAESDGILPHHGREIIKFLSTLSLRRATVASLLAVGRTGYFYPRSPCGERPKKSPLMCIIKHFYPRSPCGERRPASVTPAASRNFYPRSPCGERQLYINRTAKAVIFLSTLSLRRATQAEFFAQS